MGDGGEKRSLFETSRPGVYQDTSGKYLASSSSGAGRSTARYEVEIPCRSTESDVNKTVTSPSAGQERLQGWAKTLAKFILERQYFKLYELGRQPVGNKETAYILLTGPRASLKR